MIDVCALGPLRVSSAAYNQGKVAAGGKIIVISSQAGSLIPTPYSYARECVLVCRRYDPC